MNLGSNDQESVEPETKPVETGTGATELGEKKHGIPEWMVFVRGKSHENG